MGLPRCAVFSLRGMEAGEVGSELSDVKYSTRELDSSGDPFCASAKAALLSAKVKHRSLLPRLIWLSHIVRVKDEGTSRSNWNDLRYVVGALYQ